MLNHVLNVFLTLIFFLALPSAQGQIKGGLLGGLNSSSIKGSDNIYFGSSSDQISEKSILGYSVGVFIHFNLGEKVQLRPEFHYSTQGGLSRYEDSSPPYREDVTLSLNYVKLPILASVRMHDNFSLLLGPYVGLFLGGTMEVTIKESSEWPEFTFNEPIEFDEFDNNLDMGMIVGTEYVFHRNLSFHARYSLGLRNIHPETDSTNRILHLLVAYNL